MGLTEAVNAVADGETVVSLVSNKRYTPEMLSPIKRAPHFAIFTTAGMTESERKGKWRIAS